MAGCHQTVKNPTTVFRRETPCDSRLCISIATERRDATETIGAGRDPNSTKLFSGVRARNQVPGSGVLLPARLSPSAAMSCSKSSATPTTMKLSAKLKSGHE